MNLKKHLLQCSLFLCMGGYFSHHTYAGNPPFFPTDIEIGAKGELIMTEKGVKRVDIFAPDGQSLLRSFPM